jgi:hypothetical protein
VHSSSTLGIYLLNHSITFALKGQSLAVLDKKKKLDNSNIRGSDFMILTQLFIICVIEWLYHFSNVVDL